MSYMYDDDTPRKRNIKSWKLAIQAEEKKQYSLKLRLDESRIDSDWA